MQEEFPGNLQNIKPLRLIGKTEDPLENFFLVLSLIFNDLKGLIALDQLIKDVYRLPTSKPMEISAHAGGYHGAIFQINRLLSGLVNEFLEFVKHNEKVINSFEFQTILNKIPEKDQAVWKEIIDIAFARSTSEEVSDFTHTIKITRHNIAFHYYQTGKILRNGFLSKFFNRQKDLSNETAYYSLGSNMAETRFYYADGAAQEVVALTVGGDYRTEEFKRHQGNLIEMLDVMNTTIYHLMSQFIKTRPSR